MTPSWPMLAAIAALMALAIGARRCRCRDVSPLKALSNDVHRNLEAPLAELGARAAIDPGARSESGHLHLGNTTFPEIRVAVRTGDTPVGERAKMAKKPPHIL